MAMIDLGKLGFDLVLNKKGWNEDFASADKDIEEHESKWKQMASNIGGGIKLGIVGAVTGIAVAVGAMATEGGKSAIELQDHMAKFQSATGVTAKEADKVKGTIQELYKVNEDSYEALAGTVTALSNNMGMSADEIKKYAQNYLDYAKVTGQANEDAVGAIDDLGDAWGLTLDESVSAMDKLLVLNQEYGMSVQDSQSALTKMAPAAKAMGMSMDEASAYLAMFAQTGIDAGTASTAFTKALQAVKSPEELKKLITDIQNCEEPMQRAQMATELFGAKAGPQMAQALAESDVSIQAFIEQMGNVSGAVATASATYDKSFKVQYELVKKQLSGLFEELAERMMPIINAIFEWVVANMPQIQAILTTVFNAVGDVLSLFIGIIKTVYDAFVNWFNGTSESANKFKGNMETFKKWFSDIFEIIQNIVLVAWEYIKQVWDIYGQSIMDIISNVFNYIVTAIDVALNTVKNIINLILAVIKGDWSGAWEAVKKLFVDLWEDLQRLVQAYMEALESIIDGAYQSLLNAGKKAFSGLWDGMKEIWNSISSWVSEKVSWLADKLAFWKKSSNEMGNSSGKADGSHYNGLPYVPFDGYKAILHEGERVLTKEENRNYDNKSNTGLSVNIENFVNNRKQDVQAFAEELEFYRRQAALAKGGAY